MTPDSKIAEKKLASLELNQRLKDLPCLSDVSSTIETPELLQTKGSSNPEETGEQFDKGYFSIIITFKFKNIDAKDWFDFKISCHKLQELK